MWHGKQIDKDGEMDNPVRQACRPVHADSQAGSLTGLYTFFAARVIEANTGHTSHKCNFVLGSLKITLQIIVQYTGVHSAMQSLEVPDSLQFHARSL